MSNYDLIIMGGGPGGYVAAIIAAQNKLKVALVEKEHLGGICLNWGCIPTKALLKCSEINHLFGRADDYGFQVKDIKFDFKKIIERSRNVAKQLADGVAYLMKKKAIEVIKGTGKIISNKSVSVKDSSGKETVLTAKNIIIATGSRAKALPGLEPDGKLIMSYKDALSNNALPKNLLVIGSGAIGVEFASFYSNMGSEVSILEMQDRILPIEDLEISQFLKKDLESQGIKIHLKSKISSLEKDKKGGITAIFEVDGKKNTQAFDKVLVAAGVQSNVEGIGLESTKIKLDRGNIATNGYCETDEPGIYAIGDVASPPYLAHKASHEAIIAVTKIVGKPVKPLNRRAIPSCIYSMPQVASIGLTEQEALKLGYKLKIGKFPFIGSGKAIAIGETNGFIKTIFDEKTGELLGAHMVGAEVTEMIQGYALAMTLEATEEDLMHTVFPHPTLSEMMQESTLQAFGKAIHI